MELDLLMTMAAVIAGQIACYLFGRHTRIKDMENIGIIRKEGTGEVIAVAICDDEGEIRRVIWEEKDDTRG